MRLDVMIYYSQGIRFTPDLLYDTKKEEHLLETLRSYKGYYDYKYIFSARPATCVRA